MAAKDPLKLLKALTAEKKRSVDKTKALSTIKKKLSAAKKLTAEMKKATKAD